MSDTQSPFLQRLKDIYPFSDLDSDDLGLLLPFLERSKINPGSSIFSPGENAKTFFFILSGKVEIFLPAKGGPRKLQLLEAYDHFGEDALLNREYQTGAIAKTSVLLVKISKENIERVCRESSIIKRIFRMFAATYKNYCKTQFTWRQPTETIFLLLHRHPFFLWIKLIPLLLIVLLAFSGLLFLAFTALHNSIIWLVLAVFSLFMGLVLGLWEILAWSNEYFVLTKDRVLIQKLLVGIFESRVETPMNAILSVGLNTSFIGRLIGYGAVTARAYTGNLEINKLPDPDLVYPYLEYRRKCILADQHRQEAEAMHSMLENRFYPERTLNSRPTPPIEEKPSVVNYYADSFSDLIARFFTLRLEKDGAVIYRTHWWILLKKLFLPNLLLILIVVTTLAHITGLFNTNAVLLYSLEILAAVIGWCWWFYEYYDWRNDVYIITADQLVDVNRRPLGLEDKKAAPIKNIQTVEYERNGIIAMALNFGTVKIQIGNEELTFDDVYNPSAIQMEIFNRFHEFTEHTQKIEQKRMTEWFSTYDGIRNEDENEKGNPPRNG
jgi:hypothetical protein